MSISRQNLSIVIVTLKSSKVIHQCIESIDDNIPIIVVENSNDEKFKNNLELKYKNLKCVLSKSNIGFGAGNNIGINLSKTDYVLILNPDTILDADALNQIFLTSKKISEFSILAPISSDNNYPNYGMLNKKKVEKTNPFFRVDHVDGYAMLLNKKKFKNNFYFDDNFFLYLENTDLCLRVKRNGGGIYVISNAKIKHRGASTLDEKNKEEVELSRNWHWCWSKFYFNKKNYGFFRTLRECLLIYASAIIKYLFYSLINNNYKKKIYFNRASGFYNAFLGKSSSYRPKLKD
ncbi:glycosyltransferase [Pelagibacteraceae bacterium]|nr:glycosyltransferase [Pelagibacteraceae bacterium]